MPSHSRLFFRGLSSTARVASKATATPQSQASHAAQSQSSTSASDFKLAHPNTRPPPLPTIDPRSWSAEEAVNNILYNTPPPSRQPHTRHMLNCLVQNEPGVLSRVAGTLAARGFNIDSLVVCATEVDDLSRMCIVLRGQDGVIEQARRQLEDLVPVWAVLDYTRMKRIERELLLAKVSILGPEYFEDQLVSKLAVDDLDDLMDGSSPVQQRATLTETAAAHILPDTAAPAPRAPMTASQALNLKHNHLASINLITRQFGGRVVDLSHDSVIVEVSGKTERIDAFLKLVRPYGILESARSGAMAMSRAPITSSWSGLADEIEADDAEAFDLSQLPPG